MSEYLPGNLDQLGMRTTCQPECGDREKRNEEGDLSFVLDETCAVNLNIISPTVDLKSRDTVNRKINSTHLDTT